MKIRRESVGHYVAMIRDGQHFSFAGFSDAEWYCVLDQKEGELTGLGQMITGKHGLRLTDVILQRRYNESFLFAVPRCLWPHQADGPNGERETGGFVSGLPGFAEGQIDFWLGNNGCPIIGWERDDVLDDLARDAGLFPWIKEFSKHQLCLIGPAHLDDDRLRAALNIRKHFKISTPNFHLEAGGIDGVVADALRWGKDRQDVIYLVSAGVSAAVIIHGLHDHAMMNASWCLDMGSVWDAFVQAGGQRSWRAQLYADPARYTQWVADNLYGKGGRGW